MSSTLLRADARYTYGDYLQWPDEYRCELIGGVIYDMSPAPTRRHQEVSMELSVQVGSFLRGRPCRAYAAPFDVRLPQADEADEEIDTVVRPDLVVICDEAKLDERGCRGAPDWVVEILSPHTARKDQIRKRDLYEHHGVREYWLIQPLDGTLTLYRLRPDGRFGPAEIVETSGETPVGVLPGLTIRWEGLFLEQEVREPPPRKDVRRA
jgi:Uma2 family endonuclease